MTCIVGIASKGRVHIGGDSAGLSGYDLTLRSDEKVFRNGELIMGFTSSYRMGQLLRYSFTPPEITTNDFMRYMVADFIPAVRTTLKDGGFTTIESNVEKGGCFLVGLRGRLFEIDVDFQVGESFCGTAAIGCGDSYAKGSLFTTALDPTLKPEWRVTKALETAAHYSAGVAAPFMVLSS